MSAPQGHVARRVRRQADEILMEWGGYVRTFGEAQGSLQRMVVSEPDERMPRAAGTHSDPVFANLAAEEDLHIRRISSFDRMMRSYPQIWRQLARAMYVDCLSLEHAARLAGLTMRIAEGALALIKRQAEMDWAHTAHVGSLEMKKPHAIAKAA